MRMFGLLLGVASLLLSGCDANEINVVKKTTLYEIDDTLTLGQALDTRQDCEKTEWSVTRDVRQRVRVSYRCTLAQRYIDDINHRYAQAKEQSAKRSLNVQISDLQIDSENGNYAARINTLIKMKKEVNQEQTLINEVINIKKQMPDIYTLIMMNNGEALLFPEKTDSDAYCSYGKKGETCQSIAYPLYQKLFFKYKQNRSFSDVLIYCDKLNSADSCLSSMQQEIDELTQAQSTINAKIVALQQRLVNWAPSGELSPLTSITETLNWYVLENKTVRAAGGDFTILTHQTKKALPMTSWLYNDAMKAIYNEKPGANIPRFYLSLMCQIPELNQLCQ